MPTTLVKSERITRSPRRRPDKQAAMRLRRLRLNRGLSVKALADQIGLDHKTVGHVEEARVFPNARTMFALAQFFDLEVTDLWQM